ncbi:Protein CHUP1 [Abeliophyllum distichum]|uniref:Protein CHUP1 n=1 Tax=Abeliophyllum distichum TaxID=126358 RepID=A0ABD1VZ79_9LAMI
MARQLQLEANQTKGQLLLLKQQVSGREANEQEAFKKDVEVERKLRALNELEVEFMELKRNNKELQQEKRELIVKLHVAESITNALFNMTEVTVYVTFFTVVLGQVRV